MITSGRGGTESDARAPHVRRMDEIGVVVDRIVAVEREAAAVAARRAALVEEARLLSEADAVACRSEAETAGHRLRSESGWTPEVTAWRELVSELACALRLPERTAETLIANSRALVNDLPATHAALSAGQISYRHAEKLIDHVSSLPPAAQRGFEAVVLPHAHELTVAKFDKKARVIRERIHPESITTRTRSAVELRDVYCDPARDGMAYLSAYLPAPVAVAGWNRIDEIASGLHALPGETRTLAQLRADTFADLMVDGITDPITLRVSRVSYPYDRIPTIERIRHAETDQDEVDSVFAELIENLQADLDQHHAAEERIHASVNGVGRGIRAKTMVVVPAMTLLNRSEEPATVEGYGPIDADTARELAAGAPSWNRILTHPETGSVLSIGRDSYSVPADMKRFLQYRDQTCRHPGCNRRIQACDLDHSLDWYYDGETGTGNLAHLCKKHHHLKHHTGWRYRHVDDDGGLEFTSPTGREYTTTPDNPIQPESVGNASPRGVLSDAAPPGTVHFE